MRIRYTPVLLGLLTLLAFLPTISLAQTAYPMVMSSYPAGVERGKATIVTVNVGTSNGGGNTNLHGAYKVFVDGPGVQMEIVPPEKGWAPRDPTKPYVVPGVNAVTLKVTVAPDAPVGTREFRIATPMHGISTVGQIVIGDEPEVLENEDNNSVEKAHAVTLPVVVNGRFQQGEDVDWFKFNATEGQEIAFSVLCARLQDKVHDIAPHADPMIVLYDANGNELGRNDDFYRADSFLHYKIKKTGEYRIQIRDVNYQGNGHWVYRLNMTSRPFVIATIPSAVEVGNSQEVRILGYNLSGTTKAIVNVPAGVRKGIFETSLKLANGTSNCISLVTTDVAQASYEGGGTPESSKTGAPQVVNKGSLALPGGVNSWLGTARQIDRYKISVKKGEAYGFEVTARRIDSELDSEIRIRDANGNLHAENDDARGKDSRLDWTAPSDGDFFVEVRDLTGFGGMTVFYNLTATPLRPDFRIRCDHDRALLAPGNSTAWFVIVERQYGFGGDVAVEVKGLPAGVSALPLVIPSQMTQGVLIFNAAADAKIDMSRVEVIGTATLPGANGQPTAVSKVATPIQEIYLPGGGRGQYEVVTQGIAVTEPNDLSVVVANPNITIMPGQTIKIDVEIKRRPDYTKPVTLDLRVNHLGGVFTNPLPPGISVKDAVTIPENQSKGQIELTAAADAKPISNWQLAVMANVSINFVMKTWFVAPIKLTVAPKQ